ncbi:DNA-binding transcriptional LysR family regulator [Paenochrobactrum gallinarii]|uniref:DNA-binding transcriptional LysR family regulator n=1 Tax=Paenochrobactrum gallinarii TaxID=643673 RepID=A0A841M119_9HYPH|nr:DNA-binding transcriptional LysR family regulator [Paenochrobactrum gallinarii]
MSLVQEPLIFRSRGSSTQKIIDRAFSCVNLTPEPRLIADTRDAVYEAVSLGVGGGFMWRHGTHRADAVRRLAIDEIVTSSEEVIFALGNERNPLVDLFFRAGESYIKEHIRKKFTNAFNIYYCLCFYFVQVRHTPS